MERDRFGTVCVLGTYMDSVQGKLTVAQNALCAKDDRVVGAVDVVHCVIVKTAM